MRSQWLSLLSRLMLAVFLVASPLISNSVNASTSASNAPVVPLASTINLVTIPAIPAGVPTPTIDGVCNQAEYSGSAA